MAPTSLPVAAVLLLALLASHASGPPPGHAPKGSKIQGASSSGSQSSHRRLLQNTTTEALPATTDDSKVDEPAPTPRITGAFVLTNLSPDSQLLVLSSLFSNLRSMEPAAGTNNGTEESEADLAAQIAQPAVQAIADQLSTLSTALRQSANDTRDIFCVGWMASRLAQNTVALAAFGAPQTVTAQMLQTPLAWFLSQTVASIPTTTAAQLDQDCQSFEPTANETLQEYLTRQLGDSPTAEWWGSVLKPYEDAVAALQEQSTVTADYEASAPSDSPIETRQGDVALNVFPLWGSVNGFPLLLPSWASISQNINFDTGLWPAFLSLFGLRR